MAPMPAIDRMGRAAGCRAVAEPLAPLVVSFEVAAAPAVAFDTWVARTAMWWPKGHTVSGDPGRIVFEPAVGGRIYEVGPDGVEHAWGTVEAWEPPDRLVYRWHLFFAPDEATVVEVTFSPAAAGTAVRLEQRGWEALGAQGPVRRERTTAGWAAVTAPYRALLDTDPSHPSPREDP